MAGSWYLSARAMILPRCRSRTSGSEKTRRAVERGLSVAENAASISCGIRTGHARSRTPSDLAAASASLHRFVAAGKSGFWRTATGPSPGRTSLSNSSLLLSRSRFFSGRAQRSATDRGRDGAGDETVQFTQIERLVQIAECPLDQRVGLLPALPVSAHHEDRRIHAKVADALQQVEALSPEQGVAYSRHDHVQQNEVEALTLQDDERIGDRTHRRDLISVPVLEGGEYLPQHVEDAWLVIDDQDSFRCLRVDRHLPFGPRRSMVSHGRRGRRPTYSRGAIHAPSPQCLPFARCTARHGVRSHALSVALVGECSIPVG